MQHARISSLYLGISAYEAAKGGRSASKQSSKAVHPPIEVRAAPKKLVASEQQQKEMKLAVLKSLHNQSNSGMVRIRDVASALDAHFKNKLSKKTKPLS